MPKKGSKKKKGPQIDITPEVVKDSQALLSSPMQLQQCFFLP